MELVKEKHDIHSGPFLIIQVSLYKTPTAKVQFVENI